MRGVSRATGGPCGARSGSGCRDLPVHREPRGARIFPVHGAALDCRDRLWRAPVLWTPPRLSTRSGSEVHGASQCMDRLRDARVPQHTAWLWVAGTPQSTKRPRGVQSAPVHGQTLGCLERLRVQGHPKAQSSHGLSQSTDGPCGLWSGSGCRDRLWGAGTPQCTEEPWGTQNLPPVHGLTVECTEQLWGAGTLQNTESSSARTDPGVREAAPGAGTGLWVPGLPSVWNGHGMNGTSQGMNGLHVAQIPAVHRAAPRFMGAVGGTKNTPAPHLKHGQPWVQRGTLGCTDGSCRAAFSFALDFSPLAVAKG